MNQQSNHSCCCVERLVMVLLIVQIFSGYIGTTLALSPSSVEDLQGRIDPGLVNFYTIPNLQQGDWLYLYAGRISGNFDPFVARAIPA